MYYNLKLKEIKFEEQNINMKTIIRELSCCYRKYAFSTFPYIIEGISSKESLYKYNSGNCIALSIGLKESIKKKYNINSYLIPATIPKKYSKPGYLEISHVALLIPKSKNTYYIADPAFYFLNPIKNKKTNENKNKDIIIYSKNIYENENGHETKPENYKSIDRLVSNVKRMKNNKIFNKYQVIPKGTLYSNVYYENDKKDKWKYFVIEILNPDKAISNFFININNKPFIVTTKLDKNGICCMDVYLKFVSNNIVQLTYNGRTQNINLENTSRDKLENKLVIFNKKLSNYFNGNIVNMLLNYKKKDHFIND